ncbi:MAG: fdrA domain protein [Roseburia sp.]|nr:fdrA domain protein [Roseburia sp.]
MNQVNELFSKEIKVVNIGIQGFYEDLKKNHVPTVHMNWKPVAGGNKKMAGLLSKLK